MKLEPYLHFSGNCEEALNAYAKALNGTFTIQMRYDAPEMNAPESYKHKVLHANMIFGTNSIMASDFRPGNEAKHGNNINLSIGMKGLEKGKSIFNELSTQGQVSMPLEKQFWGAWYGEFTDRFGIRWMFNIED